MKIFWNKTKFYFLQIRGFIFLLIVIGFILYKFSHTSKSIEKHKNVYHCGSVVGLKKYQAEINSKTKTISYNGYKSHDDTVIATMLAYWAYKKNLGKFSFAMA